MKSFIKLINIILVGTIFISMVSPTYCYNVDKVSNRINRRKNDLTGSLDVNDIYNFPKKQNNFDKSNLPYHHHSTFSHPSTYWNGWEPPLASLASKLPLSHSKNIHSSKSSLISSTSSSTKSSPTNDLSTHTRNKSTQQGLANHARSKSNIIDMNKRIENPYLNYNKYHYNDDSSIIDWDDTVEDEQSIKTPHQDIKFNNNNVNHNDVVRFDYDDHPQDFNEPTSWIQHFKRSSSIASMAYVADRSSHDLKRSSRPYDVPQIQCPPADDGMERFACPSPDKLGRFRCVDDHVLCDGFVDCPQGEDEDRKACMFYKTTRAHLDVLADALLRWARGKR